MLVFEAGSLVSPVEPTMPEDKRRCSGPETPFLGFLSLHTPIKPTMLFKSIGAIDQVVVGAVTASCWEKAFTG